MEWTKYETHQERMKTLIQSKNPPNQSIMSSIDEIQSFINRIQTLGISYAEWLQKLSRHFYNPTRPTPTRTTPAQTPVTQPGRAPMTRDRSRTSTQSRQSRQSRRIWTCGRRSTSVHRTRPITRPLPVLDAAQQATRAGGVAHVVHAWPWTRAYARCEGGRGRG